MFVLPSWSRRTGDQQCLPSCECIPSEIPNMKQTLSSWYISYSFTFAWLCWMLPRPTLCAMLMNSCSGWIRPLHPPIKQEPTLIWLVCTVIQDQLVIQHEGACRLLLLNLGDIYCIFILKKKKSSAWVTMNCKSVNVPVTKIKTNPHDKIPCLSWYAGRKIKDYTIF